MSDIFNVAPSNTRRHEELCDRLQQIRDRKVSDDNIKLEAADIINDCQEPLLDIIDGLQQNFDDLKDLKW